MLERLLCAFVGGLLGGLISYSLFAHSGYPVDMHYVELIAGACALVAFIFGAAIVAFLSELF